MGHQWLKVKITNKNYVVVGTVDDEDSSERKNKSKAMVEILERQGLMAKTRSVPKAAHHKSYIEILAKGKNIPQIKKYSSRLSPTFR